MAPCRAVRIWGLGQPCRHKLKRAADHRREIEKHIVRSDERIAQHGDDNAQVKQAAPLIGVGQG